jgi:hypothetical protein
MNRHLRTRLFASSLPLFACRAFAGAAFTESSTSDALDTRDDEDEEAASRVAPTRADGRRDGARGDDGARHAVTLDEATPRRVQSDNLGYVTVGYAATFGGDVAPGPTLGGGYRYELDRFGVDAGVVLLMAQRDAAATQTGVHAGIRGLFFASPDASATPYLGLGLAFAALGSEIDHAGYSGSGLAGRVSLGYELLRESTIRFVVEADALLPAFTLARDEVEPARAGAKGDFWGATLGASLGIGWGGSSDRVASVRVYR